MLFRFHVDVIYRWWFQCFSNFPPLLGEDSHFDLSNGLVESRQLVYGMDSRTWKKTSWTEPRTLDPRIPKKHQHVRQPNRDFDRLYWQAKEAQLGSQHGFFDVFLSTKSAKGIVVKKTNAGVLAKLPDNMTWLSGKKKSLSMLAGFFWFTETTSGSKFQSFFVYFTKVHQIGVWGTETYHFFLVVSS